MGAVFALQGFGMIGVLASIGVLQSSLINAHGNADVWFVYLVIKQIVTVVYVLLFNSLGLDALMISMVVLNYVMWVPSLFIVARILNMPLLRYVGSFAVPAMSTILMLVAVEAVRMLGQPWPTSLRLVASIGAGTALYALAVFVLARDQLGRMRDIVLKRART